LIPIETPARSEGQSGRRLHRFGSTFPSLNDRFHMQPETLPAVLVVDDDEVSLALICMMLEADGYRVSRAAGGEESLKIAAEHRDEDQPAVVLADLQMPGLCGRELALALRTVLPRARLIAMSATPRAVEGYDGFTGKPFDLAAFREACQSVPEPPITHSKRSIPNVLDEGVYRKLQRMMPPASLAEVYEVCLRDARERAAQMTALAQESGDDLKEVRRLAHAIKGGAGMVGASRLAQAAAELELGSYIRNDLMELINNLLIRCDELQRILVTKVPVP
jgi:CheY-like chemotaxis protein